MASTLLEETRQAHEDAERLERLIAKDFRATQPTTHNEKLLQSHRVRQMLDSIQEREAKLVSSEQGLVGRQAGWRGPQTWAFRPAFGNWHVAEALPPSPPLWAHA
jgi:hypothetical protein